MATTQFVLSCTVLSLGKAHLVLPTESWHIKYTYMSTNDCDGKLMIPYNGLSEHWIMQGSAQDDRYFIVLSPAVRTPPCPSGWGFSCTELELASHELVLQSNSHTSTVQKHELS